VALELGVRLLARPALRAYRDYLLTGTIVQFEARAYTNYQRPRRTPTGNAFGFSDGAWTRERTPGVPRIVCLGSSTTEGGNGFGLRGSYPYQLEVLLEERTGRDFEVFNAGIAGWTSAEELVAWFLTLADFDPDVLVLHEAAGDLEPRFRADFEPDYSHWRRPMKQQPVQGLERWLVRASYLYTYLERRAGGVPDILSLTTASGPSEPLLEKGELPRASSLAFRRNVRDIARAARADAREVLLMTLPCGPAEVRGDFWRSGIAEHNQHLRELCAEHGLLLCDAAEAFAARPELGAHFRDLVHLDPQGNRVKAELAADALAGWVAALPEDGAREPPAR
jgi:lysophospholipase L1-like esterase